MDIIEQMSSSSGSSSSDSESSSGSDDDSSSSAGEDNGPASPLQPSHQQPYNSRPAVANGTSRPQGSAQLMNTLSKCALLWCLRAICSLICLVLEPINYRWLGQRKGFDEDKLGRPKTPSLFILFPLTCGYDFCQVLKLGCVGSSVFHIPGLRYASIAHLLAFKS